ncbi:pyridoxal phosphate-dependent aminotransferase [Desulforhopalus vacuolatus]|uniref:pyridoxal phosphate-dependent aminotransferase n=1 Tax=Desulforhopalus vacuolatus TaxID=40414 RepID=UPI0019662A9A|nr:pyridoxal phosphate-dependent aminotransferase [Desulforhopalus vacuolatus]MBM9519637.1 pyridoxal phosphate-dependent aminotransferase [Desulforhopalus vacuolatus]
MSVSEKMREYAKKSSWVRRMFEEGAEMKAKFGAENVFDFSLGNPDLSPPEEFNEVIQRIAADTTPGVHSYMPNGGYPWVRDAIADKLTREQGVPVTGDNLIMTVGAAGAINVTMKALLNPGDEVLLLAPYFVEYGFYVENHGGVPKVVNMKEDFSLDLQAIEDAITSKTRAIIINSPNNPTGQIYSSAELTALGEMLERVSEEVARTIYLIADEPYRAIVYDDAEVGSVFKAWRNSIVLSSFSKDLSLPGERIGFLAVNPKIRSKEELINALTLANRILGFVNAPAMMQRAVAELIDVKPDISPYVRRKKMICDVLREAGFEFTEPKGAFYVFPKTPIVDDIAFVKILAEEKILAVPGTGFYGPGHIRIAFCVPDETIINAAEGFKRAVKQAKAQGV